MFRRNRQTAGRQVAARPSAIPPHRQRANDYQIISYPDQLARWLRQVNADMSGVQLGELARRPDYGELLWQARTDGEAIRRKAATALYRKYGYAVTPDPRRPIPFSPASLFYEAFAKVGIQRQNILPVTGSNGLKALQVDLSESLKHSVFGWIFTYPDRRPPDVMVDLNAPVFVMMASPDSDGPYGDDELPRKVELPVWLIHASLCLWVLLQNWGQHTGPVTPGGQVIVPPFTHIEPNAVPIAHMFVKALYGLGTFCTPDFGCPCNRVIHLLRTPPPRHPEMTGTQPPWPYGRRPQQPQHTSHPPQRPGTVNTAPPPAPDARYQRPPGHPAAPSRPLQPGERLYPTPPTPPLGTEAGAGPGATSGERNQRDLLRDLGLDDPYDMDLPNGWDDDDEQ
ncbi:MAG TPA: hypothetical protein VFU72_08860 [Nitrolancea sp.]|nr:hypothetical protein [Nitrolancea sp.]